MSVPFRGSWAVAILAVALFAGGAPRAAEPGAAAPEAVDLSEANALVRDRSYAEAAEVLERQRADHPDDPRLLLMLGEVLIATGEPSRAADVLRHCAEVAPGRERVEFQLGTALVALGRSDEALAAFGAELENTENPDVLVMARFNRSLLLQRAGRWAEAADELEQVLQFQPDRADVYGDLATLYLQAGDLDAAAHTLMRGESIGFRSAPHYFSLAGRLYGAGRYDDAAAAFRSAIAIDPSDARFEHGLGVALEKAGRKREAAEHLRRYLELRPDAPDREQVRAVIRSFEGGS